MQKITLKTCCALMITALCGIFTSCKEKDVFPEQATINIEVVDNMQSDNVTVKFTPSENTVHYAYAIGKEGQNAAFLEEDNYPGKINVKNNESVTHTFKNLDPETKYVVYAVACDKYDKTDGPLATKLVKTYTDTFDVSTYYVSDNSAAFRITSTADYQEFSYYLGKPADREDFLNNMIEGTEKMTNTYDTYKNYFDLDSDTEYVFYVIGKNRIDKETKLFEIPIRTAKAGSDEVPNVELECTAKDFMYNTYVATPNAKCKKLAFFQKQKSDVEGNTTLFGTMNGNGMLLEMIDDMKDRPSQAYYWCFSGNAGPVTGSALNSGFKPNNEMEIYVLLYDENSEPYCVKRFYNTSYSVTPGLAVPKKEDFNVTIDAMDAPTGRVEFTIEYTGNDCQAFFFDVRQKSATDNQMKYPNYTAFKYHNEMATAYGVNSTKQLFSYKEKKASAYVVNKMILYAKAKAYVMVCPMNANGPMDTDGWGELVLYEFAMPDK